MLKRLRNSYGVCLKSFFCFKGFARKNVARVGRVGGRWAAPPSPPTPLSLLGRAGGPRPPDGHVRTGPCRAGRDLENRKKNKRKNTKHHPSLSILFKVGNTSNSSHPRGSSKDMPQNNHANACKTAQDDPNTNDLGSDGTLEEQAQPRGDDSESTPLYDV